MQFVTETLINGGGTTFQKIQHDYCNVGSLGSLGYLCVNNFSFCYSCEDWLHMYCKFMQRYVVECFEISTF